MALLLWIYVSGSVFIYGACLCAGHAEIRSLSLETTVSKQTKGMILENNRRKRQS
jgi:uncharacterized BrkB/YihY/UPF0761 family membrane protein